MKLGIRPRANIEMPSGTWPVDLGTSYTSKQRWALMMGYFFESHETVSYCGCQDIEPALGTRLHRRFAMKIATRERALTNRTWKRMLLVVGFIFPCLAKARAKGVVHRSSLT